MGEGEEIWFKGDEFEVLIIDLGEAGEGVRGEGGGCEVFEEGAREGGGEVEVEGVVEGDRGIAGDAADVGRGGLEEVDGGNVGDRLAIRLIDEEVKGDSVLSKVLNMDQRGENVSAELVHDQDLVNLLLTRIHASS